MKSPDLRFQYAQLNVTASVAGYQPQPRINSQSLRELHNIMHNSLFALSA